MIYRVLNNAIESQAYGLEDVSWAESIRVSAFVFNTKGVDDRPRAERTRYPAVLDIGFCDAQLPSLAPDYTSAKHLVYTKNALLGRKEPRKVFQSSIGYQLFLNSVKSRLTTVTRNKFHLRICPDEFNLFSRNTTANATHP